MEEPMETVRQAIERLGALGYTEDLVADGGSLRAVESERHFRPDDLVVTEVVRFEGESDPGDEAIVFALATPAGSPIGTYTVPYGIDMDPADVVLTQHLSRTAPPNVR